MAVAVAPQIAVGQPDDHQAPLLLAPAPAPAELTANGLELRERLRVLHPRFPGPGTVTRVIPELPGAVVRWDADLREPARTIIAHPRELTAIGLGREISAHLRTRFALLEQVASAASG